MTAEAAHAALVAQAMREVGAIAKLLGERAQLGSTATMEHIGSVAAALNKLAEAKALLKGGTDG